MTNEEWDKYVEKVAAKVNTYDPLHYSDHWKVIYSRKKKAEPQIAENETEIVTKAPPEKVEIKQTRGATYIYQYYTYKGETYRRKFIDKYSKKTYTMKRHREDCEDIEKFFGGSDE